MSPARTRAATTRSCSASSASSTRACCRSSRGRIASPTSHLDYIDKSADGVFMTGGNQLRLSTTIGGTAGRAAHPAPQCRRHARRRHVGGRRVHARAHDRRRQRGFTPSPDMVTMAPGLGLTNAFIIDQHFRERDRLGRLLTALAYNPFAVGIGLDEDTAAFIRPTTMFEVVGSGGITVIDPTDLSYSSMDRARRGEPVSLIGVKLHILVSGGRFEIATREPEAPKSRRDKNNENRQHQRLCRAQTCLRHFPVIRHVTRSRRARGLAHRCGSATTSSTPLLEALPGLHEHGCSYREPGGFVRRLREDEGTWMGHVMEHVAIELQNVAGSPVTFGRTRSIDGEPGHYNMVFQYKDAEVGREAGRLALELLHSLLPSEPAFDGAPGRRTGILPKSATLHPLRAAPRVRAEYGVAGQGRRGARHSRGCV